MALKALLFSGGLDSTCIAKIEKPDLLITVDYGQRAAQGEIAAAESIAAALKLKHKVLIAKPVDCGQGLMAGRDQASKKFPPEWWPFRNQYLLTVAAMHIEDGSASEILIGTVSTDSQQSDGSDSFIDRFNELLLSQKSYSSVRAPAIRMTSGQLYKMANLDPSIAGWIFSCHLSSIACGHCRGCIKSAEIVNQFREQQDRAP
ncbi:MAG: 7-cyano-7-deazaguanine synthase [Hyphomonadaceae bacterium]